MSEYFISCGYEKDEWYCTNCDERTEHLCSYSTHERDSSADHFICQQCKWEYRGITGTYSKPIEVS